MSKEITIPERIDDLIDLYEDHKFNIKTTLKYIQDEKLSQFYLGKVKAYEQFITDLKWLKGKFNATTR